jgi:hypothetical protein
LIILVSSTHERAGLFAIGPESRHRSAGRTCGVVAWTRRRRRRLGRSKIEVGKRRPGRADGVPATTSGDATTSGSSPMGRSSGTGGRGNCERHPAHRSIRTDGIYPLDDRGSRNRRGQGVRNEDGLRPERGRRPWRVVDGVETSKVWAQSPERSTATALMSFKPYFSTDSAVTGTVNVRRGDTEIPNKNFTGSPAFAFIPEIAKPFSSSGE